jgi:hypothetical protein
MAGVRCPLLVTSDEQTTYLPLILTVLTDKRKKIKTFSSEKAMYEIFFFMFVDRASQNMRVIKPT